MGKRIRNTISDYWSILLGTILIVAGMIIDFYGVQGAGVIGFIAFIILAVYQAALPRIELNKIKSTFPNVIVKRAYPKKNVETSDFVYFDGENSDVKSRYVGGTANAWEYKPAVRKIYGSTDNSEVETTNQTYLVIDFANEPTAEIEGQDAIDVVAKIKYKDSDGNNIFNKEIKGLWQGNEPSKFVNQKQDYEFTQMTLPANGDERSLCVAIKHLEDDDCFAYTLESYQRSTFLRRKDLSLGNGVILVEINLSGKNFRTHKPFIFRIVNPGKNRDISISTV